MDCKLKKKMPFLQFQVLLVHIFEKIAIKVIIVFLFRKILLKFLLSALRVI